MATTYEEIASYTVGAGGVNNFTFSSIPQTYTDLKLVLSVQVGVNYGYNQNYELNFNNDFSTTYTSNLFYAVNNTSYAGVNSMGRLVYVYLPDTAANTFTNTEFYIPNYTSTTKQKSINIDGVAERNTTSNALLHLNAGLYANTAAITSLRVGIYYNPDNFSQYSTAYLYGIKNS